MEWNIPNTPDIKFRLGSITKQFTSMLVMQLVEKGKLKLDGKITDYLPDYPKSTGDKITIHHLLTHTSGIPSYTGFPDFAETLSRNPYSPEAFVKKFSDLPLEFQPGSAFSYDNSGYFLLGVIVEKITGKPYAQVLKENILTPLRMNDTGYDLPGPILPKRAAGYEKQAGGYRNAPYLDMSIPYAAGAIYSTVEDLYRWDQALYTDQLLTASSKATMFKPFLQGYAYAWFVSKRKVGKLADSLLALSHGGGINGFNTLITRLPKDRHLVVLLNNTGVTNLSAMSANIMCILYGQSIDPPKKSLVDSFRQLVGSSSLEKALAQYGTLSKDKTFSLDEGEMNGLGYEWLGQGKVKEAMAAFNLNAEAFPQSANVYDSRGEAFMKNGDQELAIRDYRKSLELNPRNTNAVDQLRKLGEKVEAPRDATVDATVLETYVGEYVVTPTFTIKVTKENTQLYAQATGQPRFELFPESATKFYLKAVDAQVSFVKNEQGVVDQLILHQNGRDVPGKRRELSTAH